MVQADDFVNYLAGADKFRFTVEIPHGPGKRRINVEVLPETIVNLARFIAAYPQEMRQHADYHFWRRGKPEGEFPCGQCPQEYRVAKSVLVQGSWDTPPTWDRVQGWVQHLVKNISNGFRPGSSVMGGPPWLPGEPLDAVFGETKLGIEVTVVAHRNLQKALEARDAEAAEARTSAVA